MKSKSKAVLGGINQEGASLRSANQQQEPELTRPVPLPPELAAALVKEPIEGLVLMLDTEEGMREFDKVFTRLLK